MVMAHVLQVDDSNFQEEVLQSELPVLIDFTAPWCGPCKMVDPIVEELAVEWQGKVKVVQVNADEAPKVVMRFRVLGVPTLMAVVGGEVKARLTGYKPKAKIVKKFGPHLGV